MPDKTRVNGTDLELFDIAPWSRATIADGKWLNANTIKPLDDNDHILASAISDMSGAVELIQAQSDVVDVVGTYQELIDYAYPLTDRDIVKVLHDENCDSGQSYWRVSGGTSGHYEWEFVGEINDQSDWIQDNPASPQFIKNKPGETNLVAGPNIYIYEDGSDLVVSANQPQIQSDWAETDTTSASYIQNKPTTFLDLLADPEELICSGANLNDYTTPKTYFIPSANDMKEITNTPYAQMSLSDPQKTGQSHLYVFKTKTDDGRITQLLITPYSTDPADNNAFGIWYRQSSDESNLQWGQWHRVGEGGGLDPRFWVGYKNANDYLLIEVDQISVGTAGESILLSFTANQYGCMLKLCYGQTSAGGFNTAIPTIHIVECNNISSDSYIPLVGNGVAKYYYDSANQKYYFLLKTTSTNRIFATIESVKYKNYSFSVISTAPSWLSSATNIQKGHANPHIGDSRVFNQIGDTTTPVYVSAGGEVLPCSRVIPTVTSSSVSNGTNTFNQYVHPTTAGYKHIPSGGSTGQVLRYGGSTGTATWSDPIKVVSSITTNTMETGVLYVM